jgi:hypothetical protein
MGGGPDSHPSLCLSGGVLSQRCLVLDQKAVLAVTAHEYRSSFLPLFNEFVQRAQRTRALVHTSHVSATSHHFSSNIEKQNKYITL